MLFPPRRLDDPRDLKVVAALEAVGAGRSTVQLPAMSPSFRDELRAQLVAVAPRLVEEGVKPGTETAAPRAAAPAKAASGSGRAARADAPPRRAIRTRPMTVLVAGAAVVVLGVGGATWLARGALPGDALYGLKRTAEGVDVSLSGSDVDKGHALLVDAQTRVQEVDALLQRPQSMSLGTGPTASGALSDSTVKLIVSTLEAADTDTRKGVSTIGTDAIATGNQAGLTLVVGWAGGDDGKGGQIGRISSLVSRIPSGAAHDSAQASLINIDLGYQRARQLLAGLANHVTCTHGRDEFGPQPCVAGTSPAGPTTPASSTPATTKAPGAGPTSAPAPTSPTTAPSAPASTPGARVTPKPSRTATGPGGAPSTSPTPILSVGTCGVSVIGITLGTCPPGS